MYKNAVKLVHYVQIENENAETDQMNQLIGIYQEGQEFLVNPEKEPTELFCRNTTFSNRAKCI